MRLKARSYYTTSCQYLTNASVIAAREDLIYNLLIAAIHNKNKIIEISLNAYMIPRYDTGLRRR